MNDDFHYHDCGPVGGGWPHPASAHSIEGALTLATVVDEAQPVVVIGVCRKCNHYPKQLWLPARYCHKCLMKAHLASVMSTARDVAATSGEDSSDVREV